MISSPVAAQTVFTPTVSPWRDWSPRGRALAVIFISLLAWEAWQGLRVFKHPWGDLKGQTYTDHFSHMNAARVFPRIGAAIWRHGYDDLFRKLTPEEIAHLPTDVAVGGSYSGSVFSVPGWDPQKPLVSSWSRNPRNYPPGDMLLVAPISALYALTDLSFSAANRLLLMLFLLYAHLALFWILETAFESIAALGAADRRLKWIILTTTGAVYVEVIHWTLEGFYDAAALAPLVLCARFLRDRRGLAAVTAYSVAAFIHFRAYFFAPWLIYGMILIVRERQWARWRAGGAALAVLAAALGATSLVVFRILWPSLQRLPLHRPIAGSSDLLAALLQGAFLVLAGVVGRVLYRSRAWLDLAVLGWLTLMVLCLHERYAWHTELAVLPWLSAPAFPHQVGATRKVLICRGALFVGSICLLFGYEPPAIWNLWPG